MGKNTSGEKYISLVKNMEKIDFLAGSGCFNDFPGVQVVNDSSSNCVPLVCNNNSKNDFMNNKIIIT